MRLPQTLLCTAILLFARSVEGQQGSSDVPTFRVNSRLVFLDATVLDKKGRPIVEGLTKDDFTITEDGKPQRIFSFEAPETHEMVASPGNDNPDGKAPVTIFVLDLLNSNFEDFAFIRYSVRKYLSAQPMQLNSPAELMVIGNQSLEMLQGYTRNREDLLYSLNHLPTALPYKKMNGSFYAERFGQSIDALQQIALQNKGVPGRKNIVWVGHGGPGLNTAFSVGPIVDDLNRYVHDTTNMLVDARMSLFVIYPGLHVGGTAVPMSEMDADADIGDSDDPFAGDINFGVFVNETGGKLFYNRNDVDKEIQRSEQLGSEYYTLTYQPHDGDADGKFQHIRVTVRNRDFRVVTKAGYFAPDKNAPVDPRQQTMLNLAEAAESTIPFTALDVKIIGIVRHPDTRTAEFTVLLTSKDLVWHATYDGKSTTGLTMTALSLTGQDGILASKTEKLTLLSLTQDPTQLAKSTTRVKVVLRVPRKTQSVRVAIEAEEGGRIGAADVDRKALDSAPSTPTPEPQLLPHHADQATPMTLPNP
jgi:VWFA-related protein